MPILTNPRWEKFAQGLAAGLRHTDAYRQAGFASKGAAIKSCALKLSKRPEVKARFAELQRENAAAARMDRQGMIDYLIDVMLTPIGRIGSGHRLAQLVRETEQWSEVRMPDKLKAAEALAKMCGWNEERPEAATYRIVIGGDA